MAKVIVGCKLPNGIVLEWPLDVNRKVTLNGLNTAQQVVGGHIVDGTHGVTPVDEDFWDLWLATNSNFGPVLSGAIFAAGKVADVDAMAKEFAKRKTGFERAPQEVKDSKGKTVLKAATQDDDK